MKLTDSDKQELYDSITFIIETINEFPEYADDVLDSLGWGTDVGEMPNVKKLQQIRKKLFKAELRPSYRSYMD